MKIPLARLPGKSAQRPGGKVVAGFRPVQQHLRQRAGEIGAHILRMPGCLGGAAEQIYFLQMILDLLFQKIGQMVARQNVDKMLLFVKNVKK